MRGTNNQSKLTRGTKFEPTFETYKIQLPNERQPIQKFSRERNNKRLRPNQKTRDYRTTNEINHTRVNNTKRAMVSYDNSDIT